MAYLSVDVDIETKRNGINIEDLRKYFQSLSSNVISVGVHRDAGQENVKKMLWNEFGTNHKAKHDYSFTKNGEHYLIRKGSNLDIPARPVVRMYLYPRILDRIEYHYQNDMDLEKNSMLRNPTKSAEKVQNQLGEKCVLLQREKMSTGNFAPIDRKGKDQNRNSGLTEHIKGFNQPYFETGELITKIDYKIKRQ